MKQKVLSAFFITCLLTSCLDSTIEINDPTREFRVQRSMNLDSLEVGQLIRFAGFTIDNVFEPTLTYSGDTLELEIISIENGTIEIQESLTRCSNLFFGDVFYPYFGEQQQGTYEWQLQTDTLTPTGVAEGSHCIAASVLIHTCDLPLTEATNEIGSMNETDLDLFFNTEDLCPGGYCNLRQFDLLGSSYSDLKFKKDDEYTHLDGPGSITFYSREHGIVRVLRYNGDLVNSYGWDRIWDVIPFPNQEACPQEKAANED